MFSSQAAGAVPRVAGNVMYHAREAVMTGSSRKFCILLSGRLHSSPVQKIRAGEVWEGIRCLDAKPEEHHPCGEAVHEDAQQQSGGIPYRETGNQASTHRISICIPPVV